MVTPSFARFAHSYETPIIVSASQHRHRPPAGLPPLGSRAQHAEKLHGSPHPLVSLRRLLSGPSPQRCLSSVIRTIGRRSRRNGIASWGPRPEAVVSYSNERGPARPSPGRGAARRARPTAARDLPPGLRRMPRSDGRDRGSGGRKEGVNGLAGGRDSVRGRLGHAGLRLDGNHDATVQDSIQRRFASTSLIHVSSSGERGGGGGGAP